MARAIAQKILTRKNFPSSLRTLTLFLTALFLLTLAIGSFEIFRITITNKTVLFLIWTLWWPLLYLFVLLSARLWCGFFCPIGLVNDFGNKIRQGKTLNVMKWGFLAYIIFFLVVFFEQTSGLFLSPRITLAFFLTFFAIAFIMSILFQRWSFCRFVCPIGTLLGVFNRLSFLGIRTQEEKCRACTDKPCILKGPAGPCPMYNHVPSIQSNKNCLLCTKCIKNCPYTSATLTTLTPGKEIIERKNFTLSESVFVITLLGLTTILTSAGTALIRTPLQLLNIPLNGIPLRLYDFVAALLFALLAFSALAFMIKILATTTLKDALTHAGYAYIPLAFSILFITIIFDFLGPYLPFEENIPLIKYALLLLGAFWSAYLARKLMKQLSKSHTGVTSTLHLIAITLITLTWVILLIPGPLNTTNTETSVYRVTPGDVVEMNAYSMGYTPTTLIIKKDQQVRLKIFNQDIVHAFDINAANTHIILPSGKTTTVDLTFNEEGEFKYYCSVPGHAEAGMTGKIIVE